MKSGKFSAGTRLALHSARMKQLKLLSEKKYQSRKVARAISVRGANHIVLKSFKPILRKHQPLVRAIIRQTQDRFEIKLHALSVMPDHIHLIAKVSSRAQFQNALRYLAGQLALKVAGTKLWRQRAWSRVVTLGRDLKSAASYVALNTIKGGVYRDCDSWLLINGVLQL